jgi:hypothetical protein
MKNKFFSMFDYLLILVVLTLVSLGVMFIYSSSINSEGLRVTNEYIKQIIWASIGFIIMIAVTVYDYRRDHTLADSVDSIIESMNTSSRSDVESLYQEGKNIVNQIYGQTLKSQKTRDLDSAYYRYR